MDCRTPRTQKRPKGHKITKLQKCTQDPEKAKRATNSIFIKSHHRKGQDAKAMVSPKRIQTTYSGISKVIGDKNPLENFSKKIPVKARKGPTSEELNGIHFGIQPKAMP
ncbi:hypothetical protein O181_115967 [Austropuccinia psidii MF-1]|uniref:Uncharacterized protein n=1 Tax=Austropuccinia psidii MF-1 TaxID=1389203 RepID=A0A9Q3K8H5_9BASI|nr:hypothetical protein [Austropuccinia psidii MF-1]